MLLRVFLLTVLLLAQTSSAGIIMLVPQHAPAGGESGGFSLQFFGNDDGAGTEIDRAYTLANETTHDANIGSTNTTWEFQLKPTTDNTSSGMTTGANYNAIEGNIFYDRDRFDATRSYVFSLDAGRVVVGINMATDITLRATTDLRDGEWHHVAITRNATTGALEIFIDGISEATGTGPAGDISCPNTAPGSEWDPYILLGVEKHDADIVNFPSYYGHMDEVRLSTTIRYASNFTPPSEPFETDGNTASLWHFDDGSGTEAVATTGNNDFTLLQGGAQNGPQWSTDTPF